MTKKTIFLYTVVLSLGVAHIGNAQQETDDATEQPAVVDEQPGDIEGNPPDPQEDVAEETPGDIEDKPSEPEDESPENESDDTPDTEGEENSSVQEGAGMDEGASVEEDDSFEEDDEFEQEFEENEDDDGAWRPNISGFVKLDKRFLTSDSEVPMVDFYSKARLELKTWPTDNLLVVVSGEVRFYSLSGVSSSSDLSDPNKQMPFDAFPWEIYFKAHDLFAPGIDFSFGKQRITWGAADKLNPTDNLNPDDFTDIFDWGAKIPSTAAVLSYTFPNDWSLAAIWLPSVRPVLLPRAGGLDLGGGQDLTPLLGGAQVVEQEDHIDTGPFDLKHSMQAVKFSGSVLDIDFSLSYLHGYDDLPVPTELTITPVDATSVSLSTTSSFMEQHVIGADFAGELFSVGYWAEVGVFIPEGATMQITAPGPTGDPVTQEQVAVEDEVYVKYTAGLDYTFSCGFYVNVQYMHGFFVERSRDELNDYLLARLEWKFLEDKFKLALGGGGMISDWDNVKEAHGYVVMPEFSYRPFDNLELAVGAFLLDGEGDGLFSALDDQDQVYVKAVASF